MVNRNRPHPTRWRMRTSDRLQQTLLAGHSASVLRSKNTLRLIAIVIRYSAQHALLLRPYELRDFLFKSCGRHVVS